MTKQAKPMPWRPSITLLCLLIIILYRSAGYLSSQLISRLHGPPVPCPRSNVQVLSTHSFVIDCQTHLNNILLNYDRKCIHVNASFYANGDEKSSNGDSSSDRDSPKSDDKPEETREEEKQKEEDPKQEEQQQQQHHVGSSRIPTYDEFARFRDSSRPPDSHYPPGPATGFRRRNAAPTKPAPALLVYLHIAVCILGI